MDPYALQAPDGWFGVERAPEWKPNSQPQQLFPHTSSSSQQQQQQNNDETSNDNDDSPASSLHGYLQSLVARVENRPTTTDGGGPLRTVELGELMIQASREEEHNLWGATDVDTLTTLAGYLYEHILEASSLSVLTEARRIFANPDNLAPSAAMAALQEVSVCTTIALDKTNNYTNKKDDGGDLRLGYFVDLTHVYSSSSLFLKQHLYYFFPLVDQNQRTCQGRNPPTGNRGSQYLVTMGRNPRGRQPDRSRRCLTSNRGSFPSSLDTTHCSIVESDGVATATTG
jgi:hypothetical protein